MATDGGLQMPVETAATVSDTPVVPTRVTDDDGHIVEIFPLPTDESTLERMLRELFESHWDKIVFGPIIQGAAWEFQAPHAPTHVGVLDGYLTVALVPHTSTCALVRRAGHVTIQPHQSSPSIGAVRRLSSSAACRSMGRQAHGGCASGTAMASSRPPLSSQTRFCPMTARKFSIHLTGRASIFGTNSGSAMPACKVSTCRPIRQGFSPRLTTPRSTMATMQRVNTR